MKILWLVRSTKPFRTQRPDVDDLLDALLARGHSIDIYDPKQRLLMDCVNAKMVPFGPMAKWLARWPYGLLTNFLTLLRFAASRQRAYDTTHFFYVREEYLLAPKRMTRTAGRSIATLYGSDVNLDNPIKHYRRGFYEDVTFITSTSTDLATTFLNRRRLRHLQSKCRTLVFPQTRLKELYAATWDSKCAARRMLGWSESTPVIVFGTNALPNEQHIAIADALTSFVPKYPVQVVFPITYGIDAPSRRRLIDSIRSRVPHLQPIFIDRILSDEELHRLRLATTIFVNLRRKDQMAASMFEAIISRSDVLTGAWLPYADIQDCGVQLHRINRIDELPFALNAILQEGSDDVCARLDRNRAAMWQRYNPDRCLAEWLAFYEDAPTQ